MAKTIAAISTPNAVGGIAVIRISGSDAIKVADSIFSADLAKMAGYTAAFGSISNNKIKIDDGIATVFRAPHSYTGEDIVEISCHGGSYVSREVLRAALENGAQLAEPGEFTKRAFLNGKLDLTKAEAIADLIEAKSDEAYKLAQSGYNGSLFEKINDVKTRLLAAASHLAAWADYPEEDLVPVDEAELLAELRDIDSLLVKLLATFDRGKLIKQGIDTVIAGKPNVGKSTLMNLLSGYKRSIVTDVAGTTRDVVEEDVLLGGILLRLSDTAGIRETSDKVEKIGVDMAVERVQSAILTIAVFDGSLPLDSGDMALINSVNTKRSVAVINKADLPQKADISVIKEKFDIVISISALSEEALADIQQAVSAAVEINELSSESAVLVTERQRKTVFAAEQSVAEAVNALEAGLTLDAVTVMAEDAISSLLELTGERATEEVVNSVFSHFCVGK